VLHYAQEIFEGLKAYRLADGSLALFRPDENARRFNASARGLAMPALPEETFVEAVRQLVLADRAWFPPVEGGSLYLRPFMFAVGAVPRGAAGQGIQVPGDLQPGRQLLQVGRAGGVDLGLRGLHSRRAGRHRAAKCGGNYAASLVPQAEAIAQGHDQVVFLDAAEHRWVEELGGMNVFFAFDDGTLVTPPLSGTILPGITRESLLELAREEGLTVREERYGHRPVARRREQRAAGRVLRLRHRAVVTPIGRVAGNGRVHSRRRRAGPADHPAARAAGGDPARRRPRTPTAG
jgi:branched-chain amino acid aminotransferase